MFICFRFLNVYILFVFSLKTLHSLLKLLMIMLIKKKSLKPITTKRLPDSR